MRPQERGTDLAHVADATFRPRPSSVAPTPAAATNPHPLPLLLAPLLRAAAGAARLLTATDRAAAAVGSGRRHTLFAEQDGPGALLADEVIRAAARFVRRGRILTSSECIVRTATPTGARAIAAVPLRLGATHGCLLGADHSRRDFSDSEITSLRGVAHWTELVGHGIEAAVLAERQQLARKLHDTFGQTLTTLVFAADELQELLADDVQHGLACVVRSLALESVQQLRQMIDFAERPPAAE